ncbi:MAG: hypothetical protein P4N24_13685 [Acidobacteriota bacterium]|nr:hypothetical protein [Acidobacteriota bacterium]
MNRITRRDFMLKAGAATALSYGPGLGASPLATHGAGASGDDAASSKPTWKSEGDLWIGSNASMEVAVSRRTGTIQRLIDKVSGEDYCHQNTEDPKWPAALGAPYEVAPRIGGLILIDELRNKRFSDLEIDCAIEAPEIKTTSASVSFTFHKKYPTAEFTVWQTFRVTADHLRWDVRIKKDMGPDRTVRVIQAAPLPLRDYAGWAPIAEAPFTVKPYLPFAIEYGQSTAGAVGEPEWRTNIPMTVFYSRKTRRAICFTAPVEIPAVRIRFLNNTSAEADFHFNSRQYPQRERPYFQVSHEYLGIRDKRDMETGLLISVHPAEWRPALGWVYSQYQEYFDPQPNFDAWDGVYASGNEWMKDSLTGAEVNAAYAGLRDRGNRWEELHGHFPRYGLMIPEPSVKSWVCESHPRPGTTMTREKIAAHATTARQFGVGTFIYYNTTEAEYWYAQQAFPDSIAKAESGKPLGAWHAADYPDRRACYLMNSDTATSFGKHMMQQAEAMVAAYPAIAGFFWDVYGRSYLFDFAHDDGITMVDNRPAYYPEFMYQRMMQQHVAELLHSKGMCVTANKPVTLASCWGVDGIMSSEDVTQEENPGWIAAQSYLGLNRHVMILSGEGARDPELLFLHCLHYGMFYSDVPTTDAHAGTLPSGHAARTADLVKKYHPFIERLRGKKWIFYPQALELPSYATGNIFRLKDGSVMVTMVSAWRHLRKVDNTDENLEVNCRLPDADKMKNFRATAIDLGESWSLEPTRNGDTLKFVVPRHGKATVILLSA